MEKAETDRLAAGASALGTPLDARQLDAFARYADLLVEWNARMNLTRVPPAEFVERHFLDSLAGCAPARAARARTAIDVGTGAGLPGIPWKIAYPRLRITLLDGTRKRLDFLEAVVAALGLRGVALVHGRAEEVSRDAAHRGRYDIAVARAVAPMDRLAGWLMPFVAPAGVALAMKSAGAEDEIAAAGPAVTAARGRIASTRRVIIPGADVERLLVVMERAPRPTGFGDRRPPR